MTWRAALLAALVAVALPVAAQEAAIRKNLEQRLPDFPKIDEVRETPMGGLYEVRSGGEIFYSDAAGDFILHGSLLDTKSRKNLTEERMEKLMAVDFSTLNTKNAIPLVYGKGTRKMAVFEDPNCGYCKRFEKDVAQIDDVTMYVFVVPILGPNSQEKSKQIWCAKDRSKVWTDWMQHNVAPTGKGDCDTKALEENVAFIRQHRITGTPTMIFTDGTRAAGAIGKERIEERLARK